MYIYIQQYTQATDFITNKSRLYNKYNSAGVLDLRPFRTLPTKSTHILSNPLLILILEQVLIVVLCIKSMSICVEEHATQAATTSTPVAILVHIYMFTISPHPPR